MTALVAALTALGQQLAANNNAANAAHFAAVEEHLTKLDAAEGADASAIADTQATVADTKAGLQAFIAAYNGSSSAAGTSTGTAAATTAQAS